MRPPVALNLHWERCVREIEARGDEVGIHAGVRRAVVQEGDQSWNCAFDGEQVFGGEPEAEDGWHPATPHSTGVSSAGKGAHDLFVVGKTWG